MFRSLFAAVAAPLLLAAAPAWAAKVDAFSPQGESKGVRQVAVRFSDPMVAFGDPRLDDPFTVKCEGDPAALKGKGRWADATNWVYDFDADLPAGQRCRFSLKVGAKTSDNVALTGKRDFDFHTGGPAVVVSMPREGHTAVDEEQAFILLFDGPVDPASLNHLWCEAKGINERIPTTLLTDKEARDILAANKQLAYRYYRLWFKGPRPIPIHDFRLEDKRFQTMPLVGVRCSRKLPNAAEMSVVVGEGVKTRTGIPRGVEQRLAYQVRPAFTLTFRCQKVNKDAQCLPATPMTLSFNSPVPRELASRVWLKSANRVQRGEIDPKVNVVDSIRFDGPFAESANFTIELPKDFKDDAGRVPSNAASFPLAVKTDVYPPLVKFPGRFGILEAGNATLPITVRGIEPDMKGVQVDTTASSGEPIPGKTMRVDNDEEQILKRFFAYMKRTEISPWEGRKNSQTGDITAIEASDKSTPVKLPRPAAGRTLEVIGIPLPKPGFYLVEFESPRLGSALHGVPDKPYFVSTSVLVTNYAVHLKHGRENSLVWVTSLADGKPVRDAKVTVRDCRGKLHFEGKTDGDGIAVAGDKLPQLRGYPPCPLIAFARVGEDVSFTFSNWREGIEPWNFGMNTGYWKQRPLSIHTVFDRTLFRAGETVSMKHIARVTSGNGFKMPAADQYPKMASLFHAGTGQKVELQVKFDAQGVAESTWAIPKEAKLGQYYLQWEYRGSLESNANFRVEAFRVPLMRASLAAPKEAQIRATKTKVDAAVNYLAGGPASNLPVKVRHRIEPRGVGFAEYGDFMFNGEEVKEGTRSGADPWATYDPESDDEGAQETEAEAAGPISTKTYTLDAAGTAALTFEKLPVSPKPANLVVEMEYADPNGELLSTSTRVALHPSSLYVGIRPDGWAATKAGVNAQVVVVDTSGKPVAGRQVVVDVFERQTYSSRRRVLGGFYAYDSITETKKIGTGCTGTTDARGLIFCSAKPGKGGELLLVARVQDDQKRTSFGMTSLWVIGEDDWWFDPSSNDRMELVAEKRRYEPGENAKLQVRMPFRSATVLVTVEREGVLSHKVVTLQGKGPVVDVPMLGHYGPNVYVSALAVRGRVGGADAPKPTGLVDLAKPAYKLGMTNINVGRREYELKVKVTPDREVFKVREKARVAIEVTDSSGKPAANGEIALAAVDEGLLELMNNASWNILDALLGQRPQEVSTATAQGHVIGKRHFGKKAVAAGGGGGREGARELFDTLLLWKGRVPLDANGRATVEIPLNDSLTSFRIVAVSHSGVAKFGEGHTTIRTTQDLMLFSGLPPVMREQDDFTAMFTVRNTTAAPLDTRLQWTVYDRAADDKARKSIGTGESRVTLAANESRIVSAPYKVPVDVRKLHWEVTATTSGGARDTLRVGQDVTPVHPVRVYQATLARMDKPTIFYVERPADAIPGRGSIRVELMGTLVGDMVAVREWFNYYPYSCMEQRASKAIGLRAESLWRGVAASLPNYQDRDGLVRYFPNEMLEGSDALTAYLVQIADADKREWEPSSLNRMLSGLEAFATGKIVRGSALPTADLTVRKLAAIEALSRHERAKPEMLDSIGIDPARWPTSALIDWIGILKRVPVKDAATKLEQAHSILRSRLNFQGTVMTFSTERSDALWWLMVSTDVNANRALLAVLEEGAWKEDIGRLVRGALSRQLRGVWSTTVANAWGTVAMERYAEVFEKVPATGTTVVSFSHSDHKMEVGADRVMKDFAWPAQRERLALEHKGEGKPWVIVQSRAALPLKQPLETGYKIRRTVKSVEQKDPSAYSRGDVYRVTLEIEAQSDMTWVVVDDPIPSGATILGSGLGGDSATLTRGERREGWAWPAYIERTFSAYRAYYAYVPKGKFTVEYTARLNNAGRFDLPATRVEAMYAPEMLGETPNPSIEVKP
ncbi:alpha-2-macroglobulin family protein [Usitatibacter palustris]|uniref:Alpha-2-macroglobulin n=1 Tax=Usitatibacter palustris TaxID=2732487 RepID=A0A6M4H8D1_9PROT|nr:MG2 domain-containing protein [Usitatibacter palustris]QJR15088.1 hypothetical protein DSM104440_01904 [Usitatibacter palustris]